jgi:hypothetical protein
MKFAVLVLLLFSISASADSIPTYEATALSIHNMDQLLFSGPANSGELRTFGQVPMGSSVFSTSSPTLVLQFSMMDIFADPPSYPYGTVDRGPGALPVSYPWNFDTCGAGFPGTTQITFSPNPSPAAGTLVVVSAPVTFCGTIAMWDSNNPYTSPPDFYVAFNNLQGIGTYVLESQGQLDTPNGSFTAYRWISLDYQAFAVPEPATLTLCGFAVALGGIKRLRARD